MNGKPAVGGALRDLTANTLLSSRAGHVPLPVYRRVVRYLLLPLKPHRHQDDERKPKGVRQRPHHQVGTDAARDEGTSHCGHGGSRHQAIVWLGIK